MVSRLAVTSIMSSVKPRVFVTREIPQGALHRLKDKCDVDTWPEPRPVPNDRLLEGIRESDGLFCLLTDKIDRAVLDAGIKLKVIGTMSVGYDHIDVQACRERGILLGYTPNVLTEATAELTVALLLCTARRLVEGTQEVVSGGWGTWQPLWMCGQGIHGSVIGIIGLGRIGVSVAEKLVPFHPERIIYHGRSQNPDGASKVGAKYVSKDELLHQSDFIIICCALTKETTNFIDHDAFSKMKPNAILINTSRGPIVDQESLYDALNQNRIRAAGLDVCVPEPLPTDHKLLKLKNFVQLPHIGSATERSRNAMADLTVDNILAGLEGRPLPASIP